MVSYVLGFLFDEFGKDTLLIKKINPAWQKGKLNGIGGKVIVGENPEDAMTREFAEETGLEFYKWMPCITLISKKTDWIVTIFKGYSPIIRKAKSITAEKIRIVDSEKLPSGCMKNLYWIIPMIKDDLKFPIEIVDMCSGS